jgi:short subunit dehydrogenase-like uncharacterized protein
VSVERTFDVLLLDAAGSSGRLVARELTDRRLSVLLAGRHPEILAAPAAELSASGAEVEGVSVARRILAGAPAGAFTPGRLFGKDLFAAVTAATRASLSTRPG